MKLLSVMLLSGAVLANLYGPVYAGNPEEAAPSSVKAKRSRTDVSESENANGNSSQSPVKKHKGQTEGPSTGLSPQLEQFIGQISSLSYETKIVPYWFRDDFVSHITDEQVRMWSIHLNLSFLSGVVYTKFIQKFPGHEELKRLSETAARARDLVARSNDRDKPLIEELSHSHQILLKRSKAASMKYLEMHGHLSEMVEIMMKLDGKEASDGQITKPVIESFIFGDWGWKKPREMPVHLYL